MAKKAAIQDSVVDESFDDWLEGFESRLDARGRAMYDAFSAEYDLANAVIARRKELHLTQQQLADMAGVHQSDISRLERGTANIPQRPLSRIAAVLGANLALVPRRSTRAA